jgi:uncharacterized protein (DUF1684 family)
MVLNPEVVSMRRPLSRRVRECLWPKRRAAIAALALGSLTLAGCGAGPPEPIPLDEDEHRMIAQTFMVNRVGEIAAPDSWLSLIGLYWLPEGETTIGADPSNDVVLPAGKAAPVLGRVVREGTSVRFVAAEGVEVTMGIDSTLSLPAGSGAFPPDVSGDPLITNEALGSAGPGKAIVMRHGSINWILVSRGEEFALRLRDNESPAYAEFTDIDRYPVSADWRLTARWVSHEKTVLVPNVLGTASEAESPAFLEFWIDGDRHVLDVTGDVDKDRFMMVFADETSGRGTYGGGRYVWFDKPDEDGRVLLDFNLAYNPPCVWTGYATCPLPTRDNRLAVAVLSGEKDWVH